MPPLPKSNTPAKRNNRNLFIALAVAAVVAAALIVGSIVLRGGSDSSSGTTGTTSSGTALVAGIPQSGTILGNPDAKVTMVQYEDFQCPICREYTVDALPAIVNEYVKTGKVKLDYHGLSFLGTDSVKALRVALAAGKQNKLWEVAELFYEQQGDENSGWVTDEKVNEILAQVPGLDADKVLADAESPAITAEIEKVNQEASDRDVQGTPTFFIAIGAGEPYRLAPTSLTPDAFRPALDDALQG
jgi:protein-disulfide isomerase